MRAAARELLLDCGDGVVLQAFHSRPEAGRKDRSVVVMLHGWEGSADSLYVLSLAQMLFERGHEIVRLNLRDHGETHHLNQELFHSCRLPEVVGAVEALQRQFAGATLQLVGFSLGGNFMLRVAAEAPATGLQIGNVVAVSPVLDPARTMDALENGLGVYHDYFVRKWTRSLLIKQGAWPQHYDFAELLRTRSLRQMTAELVRLCTSYASIDDYLSGYAITGSRLAAITAPTTLIVALDDPIIPAGDLDRIARPPSMHVITCAHGGHCGFLEGLNRPSWVNRLIVQGLEHPPHGASPRSARSADRS